MQKKRTDTELINLIFSYTRRLQSSSSTEETLLLLADLGRNIVNAERCTVWMLSKDLKTLWTRAAHGLEKFSIPSGTGLVGHAMKNKEEIIVNNVYSDSRFDPSVDTATGYKTRNMIVTPMLSRNGNVIGAFQVINKIKADFEDEDIERIILASGYAAETIESATLQEENNESQKEMLYIMSDAVESRSKETGNHIKRVAKYSRLLAIASGLDEATADEIEAASPMHDIGKIGTPDAILNKPGKLTEDEFEVMKEHATLGFELLNNSNRGIMKKAAIIAYEHHEKYDGSGYPRGLRGEEISIYGRIVAIADVFDALGSDRCYKKAWEEEKIINFFVENKGSHFDPALIDLFMENLEEVYSIRDEYRDNCQNV